MTYDADLGWGFREVAARTSRAVVPARPDSKGVLYKLDDPDVQRELHKKYGHLLRPAPMFRKAFEAYAVLGQVVSAPCFSAAGGYARTEDEVRQSSVANCVSQMTAMFAIGPYIKNLGDKGVEVGFPAPRLKCRLSGLPNAPTAAQKDARKASEGIIKGLFPKIKLDAPVARVNIDFGEQVSEIPLEALAQIKTPGVDKLVIPGDFPYKGMVRAKLTLVGAVLGDVATSDHLTQQDTAYLEVDVRFYVTYPQEYALWSTEAQNAAEFVPFFFWRHMVRTSNYYVKLPEKEKAPPYRTLSLFRLQRDAQKAKDEYGVGGTPPVNAEGICVLPSGEVLWVPPEGAPSDFSAAAAAAIGEDNVAVKERLATKHAWTDWTIGRVYYTNGDGDLTVKDLTGARPLTPVMVAFMQQTLLFDDKSVWERISELVAANCSSKIAPDVVRNSSRVKWENLIDVPFEADEDAAINSRMYRSGESVTELWNMLDRLQLPVVTLMSIKPYLALVAVYGRRRQEFATMLGAQYTENSTKVPAVLPVLHDLGGLEGVMPHQREVFAELGTQPHAAVIDIDAGGGKTLAYIMDVTGLMASGKVKRPIIVMPNNLIAQFAEQGTMFTKGHYRFFPITSAVWRQLRSEVGATAIALKKLIDAQPKNTIFLADYVFNAWVAPDKSKYEDDDEIAAKRKRTGGKARPRNEALFFPYAEMLASSGFDYVCFDESQRAKNAATARTKAANVLAARAEFVRIGSGTILGNTARDLIGQLSLINPIALGAMADEIKENDKLAVADVPELQRRVNTFARQIVVKRRKWAHLLPPVIERVHTVTLTRKQREFYDVALKDLIAKIQDDPKIRKLMATPGAAAEAQLEMVFNRELSKLEIWLNAPDSTRAGMYGSQFRNLDNVTDADLKSPKVERIDKLLEQHFNGGRTEVEGKDVDVEPEKFKAIVFSYNKAVSEHLFRHSRFSNRAVWYTAGDMEALRRFKEDDDAEVLFADENSINEGHNLQMASRLIRVQSLWTPGSQEQALARVVRPSVPDKNGNVKYPRTKIWLDWVVVDDTLEVTKMARLIGKQIENSILQEVESNANLARVVEENKVIFDDMPRIKMSWDNLAEFSTADKLPAFFEAYRVYKGWEKGEFIAERAKVKAEIEEREGRAIPDSEVGSRSMIPVTSEEDSSLDPGKQLYAHGYTPWVQGFTGATPNEFHLEPLSLPLPPNENEDEEEDDEDSEVEVQSGDVVMTEYGLGIVEGSRSNSKVINVNIPGVKSAGGGNFKLPRYLVKAPWIFPKPDETAAQRAQRMQVIDVARRALKLLLDTKRSVNVLRVGDDGSMSPVSNAVPLDSFVKIAKSAAAMKPTRPSSATDGGARLPAARPLAPERDRGARVRPPVEEPEDEVLEVDIEATAFNGQLALIAPVAEEGENDEADAILKKSGFDRLGKTVAIKVRTPRGFRDLIEALARKFLIPRAQKRLLDHFADLFDKHKQNVAWLRAQEYAAHMVWLKDQRVMAKDPKSEIRPYPVVENGTVYLYVNLETCPAAKKLKTFAYPSGVTPPKAPLAPGHVCMVASRTEAAQVLRDLESRGLVVTDKARVMAELKQLK